MYDTIRARTRLVLAAAAALLLGLLLAAPALTPSATADTLTDGGLFMPVTPTRLMDTQTGVGGYSTGFGAGVARSLQVTGVAGIPTTGVSAVVIDVAVTSATASGVLNAYPSGSDVSAYSFLRFDSTTIPVTNTAIVAVGADGKIMLRNSTGTTNMNVDIEGYFTDGSTNTTGNGYNTMTPVRALGTAQGVGDLGSSPLKGSTTYTQQIAGLGEIPTDATAVFANIRVASATTDGALRVSASDTDVTTVAPGLNYQDATFNETGATIKLGADGKIKFRSSAATTSSYNIIIDVTGYFTGNSSAGGGFHPLNSVRLYDGRGETEASTVHIAPNSYVDATVAGIAGIPEDGSAAAVALTVLALRWDVSGGGSVSLYDPDEGSGGTSTLGYSGDTTTAGVGIAVSTITAISSDGTVRIKNTSNTSTVIVALAAQGWFTAPPTDQAELDEAANAGSQDPTATDTTQSVSDAQCAQDVESQLAGTTATSTDIADAVSQWCDYDDNVTTDAPDAVTVIDDSDESLTDAPASTDTADGSTITSSQAASLTSTDGTTLAAAAKKRTIYFVRWSQYKISATWKETNSGTFYYDRKGHVWSTTMTYGYKGKHQCTDNYSVGYTISHTHCNTERRYDLSGAGGHPISEWDIFKVSAIYKGFPIFFTHKMHINAYANGTIGWH